MIGALTKRIELLVRVPAADGAGGQSVLWAPATAPWAQITELPSAETQDGGARFARRLKVWVRSKYPFSLGGRLRIDGADFEIVSIESDDAAGRRLFLTCESIP